MRPLDSFIIVFLIAFCFSACATTNKIEKKPASTFESLTLSKQIEKKQTSALPGESTGFFTTQDKEVIACLKFHNLYGKHTLRWDWYGPTGHLYHSSGNFPLEIKDGFFVKEATPWHQLKIKGDKATGMPGEWTLKVLFDGEIIQTRTFTLKKIVDVENLPTTFTKKTVPKYWGLIIGIENYAHLPNVEYARKDAVIMKEYFNKVLGVPAENTITLVDGEATMGRIKGYIKRYLPANMDRDSTLFVYFAGHGAPDIKKGQAYLVPHDGDTKFIDQTGYPLKEFYSDLEAINIDRTYVFLDSCFSGVASRAAEMLIKGARPALVHIEDLKLTSKDVVSLSATSAGQISNAYPEAGHGLFTYYLLRALSGESDTDNNDKISIKEIYQYVKTNVVKDSRRIGNEQTPSITPSLERLGNMSLCRLPAK